MRIKTSRLVAVSFVATLVAMAYSQLAQNIVPIVNAAPVNLVVTNANDSGAGSLRAALTTANGNGNPADTDTITFDINADAPGDVVIEPLTPLTITQRVTINGYSQGDAQANTAVWPNPFNGLLRVTINGSMAGSMTVTGDNVTIQGINFANSTDADVTVTGADNFHFYGNYLGTTPNGMELGRSANVSTRSLILEDTVDADIGGTTGAARNVFGFCALNCIEVRGVASSGTDIRGNYIGLAPDGITSLDTTYFSNYGANRQSAVVILDGASDVVIGGSASGAGNSFEHNAEGAIFGQDSSNISILGNRILYNFFNNGPQKTGISFQGVVDSSIGGAGAAGNIISGNQREAIDIRDSALTSTASENITIEGNKIGVMGDGTTAFPNFWGIIVAENTADVLILENTIAHTGHGPGVFVQDNAQRISILGNSINDNEDKGISLAGTNTADTGDGDAGPNNGLNAPGYTQIVEDGGNTEGKFTMDVPAGDYRIEFFSNDVADPDHPGEGQTYIDSVSVTSSGTGLEEFNFLIPGVGHDNLSLTATEENVASPSGFGPTSEFGTTGLTQVVDLNVSTSLLNPEDFVQGNALNYEVTITNDGPNSLNLSTLNATSFNSDYLFAMIVPAGYTYSSVTGSGISCVDSGAGSAGGMGGLFATHTTYSVVTCAHTGGSTILANAQSVTYTIALLKTTSARESFSVYTITNTPGFDPDYTAYQDAITSGSDIIDEMLATPFNNFDDTTYAYEPSSDFSSNAVLLNPEDFALGGILNYQITLTNNGPDDFDLNMLNNPSPLAGTDLFMSFLPPSLTYTGVAGSNVACSAYGALLNGVLPNHPDHSVVVCAHTGGSTIFASGQSISYTISAEVTDDSQPEFFVHVLAQFANPSEKDPDAPAVGAAAGSGNDLFDEVLIHGVNNYSRAFSQPADTSLEATLVNPEDVAPGATLTYSVQFVNNGPSPIDPRELDGQGGVTPFDNVLFVGVLPPNLTFVEALNPDVSCQWAGPGSASLMGPLLADHPGSLMLCTYVGSMVSLASGQSIPIDFSVTTASAPDSFTSYFFSFGTPADSTYTNLYRLLNRTDDIINSLRSTNDNGLVLAVYTAPGIDPPTDGNGNNGGSNGGGGTQHDSGLGETGQRILVALPLVLLLVSSVALILYKRKSKRSYHS